MSKFDIDDPFKDLTSVEKQIDALKLEFNYVEPVEKNLGYRIEDRYDASLEETVPTKVYETFQYVPIIDVLKLILSNKEARYYIMFERTASIDLNVLSSFVDGETCLNHEFFQKYKNAIRLKIYYDEFEIVNPLGSKTGIHKIGGFYFVIDNLPPHVNSAVSNIHIFTLCYDADAVKYSFKEILRPFLADLRKLESDGGVPIDLAGEEFILRASISALCGDGLAIQKLYEMLSPSCNYFCRMCMISREELHNGSDGPFEKRSKELHATQLQMLADNPGNAAVMTATGMRSDCSLNVSRYFHSTENYGGFDCNA